MMTTGAQTSLRQLARLIGVNEKAVRKARAAGVFSDQAVGRDEVGNPVVRDVTLAVAEWERSGRRLRGSARRPPTRPAAAVGRAVDEDLEGQEDADLLPVLPPLPTVEELDASSPSLVRAQTTAMLERARKLRLENDQREGQLLDASKAAREAFEFARIVRESVLNLPARLSAQLAAEQDPAHVYSLLDRALREALEATAAAMDAEPAAVNE